MNKVTELELVARPRKATIACWIAAVAVVAGSTFAATAMRGLTEGGGVFHAADQYAMIGLGLLFGAGILLFTRPRVWVSADEVVVRNAIGSYRLPWEVVMAVKFPKGASWAQLELADDDVVSVMAIQATDKDRAVVAVRRLREALDAHRGKA